MAKLLIAMILLAGAIPIAPMSIAKLPITAVPMVAVFTTANVTYSSNNLIITKQHAMVMIHTNHSKLFYWH